MADSTRRRVQVALAAAVVVALVVGATTWWSRRDDRPRAAAGRVFPQPIGSTVDAAAGVVTVPWGQLSVKVTAPVREVPNGGTVRADVRAPEDGGFVGISVDVLGDQMIPLVRTPKGVIMAPEVTLLAGDRRYPVPDLVRVDAKRSTMTNEERTAYVAVPAPAGNLRLEVSYDGRRQVMNRDGSIGEPGPFAMLSGVPREYAARVCGRARWPAGFVAGRAFADDKKELCMVGWAARTPYVAGLGWAPEGKAWLAVTQIGTPPGGVVWRSPSGRKVDYGVEFLESLRQVEFALAGRPPVAVVDLNSLGGMTLSSLDQPTQAIFAVEAGSRRTTVTITQTIKLDDPDEPAQGAPRPSELRVSWQVAVP